MKKPANGFNKVAGIYDGLAKLVFGRSIKRSQEFFISKVADKKTVLILGGGTGWILGSLSAVNFKGEVFYIEASSAMVELAKTQRPGDFDTHFIHGTEEDIPDHIVFDGVITNFFLDLFPDSMLPGLITGITRRLHPDGIWLVTDFTNSKKWWHQVLLHSMYVFFRMTTGLRNKSLPDWEAALSSCDVIATEEEKFFNGFIRSTVRIYQPRSR